MDLIKIWKSPNQEENPIKYRNYKPIPNRENFYKSNKKFNKPRNTTDKPYPKKTNFNKNKFIPTYYKCGKVGHIKNKCPTKNKINSLDINEHLKEQLTKLLINFDSSEYELDTLQSEFQLQSQSSSFENKTINQYCICNTINVISKEQELIWEIIKEINDP